MPGLDPTAGTPRKQGRSGMGAVRVAALIAALAAFALNAPAQRAVYELYGNERGLTNLSITAWAQDQDGFVWVGTERGLFRFDGGQFQYFGEEDGLPHTLVMGLKVGPDGTLWVSTYGGLALRRGKRFERPNHHLLRGAVAAQGVAFDGHKVYFGTRYGVAQGEVPAPGQPWRLDLLPAKGPGRSALVKSLATGPFGEVWWGCGKGLCRFAGKYLEQFGEPEGVPEDDYLSIAVDEGGWVWARSRQRLLELGPWESQFREHGEGVVSPTMTAYAPISLDAKGTLMAGTMRGLAMREGGRWRLLDATQGLPVSGVAGAWSDREGALWVALNGAGLARLPGYSEWASYSQPDGLAGDVVVGMGEGRTGEIWVATSGGLAVGRQNEGRWLWTRLAVPGMEVIHSMSQSPDGSLLLAGSGSQILKLDPWTRRWTGLPGTQGTAYHALMDSEGRVWVSTDRGLFVTRTEDGRMTLEEVADRAMEDPAIPGKRPVFVGGALGKRKGEMWFSTFSGLLHHYNGKWTRIGVKDGLRSSLLSLPSVGPRGEVWLGYRDRGAGVRVWVEGGSFKTESFEGVKSQAGEFYYSFHFERDGTVWALTSNGLQVRTHGGWMRLDRSDGLLWDECSQGAFLRSQDGSYWVGTSRGVSEFRPKDRLVPQQPPVAAITEIRWAGGRVEPEDGVLPKIDGRSVRFRFAALRFGHSASTRFRYRIDGTDWVETAERTLNLEQLGAGRHRVEVIAGNVETGWGTQVQRAEFEVAPRWYELWWVRLVLATMSLAMAAFVWRVRTRRQEEARRALERAVQIRTEQLQEEKTKVEKQHLEIGRLLEKAIEASRLKSEFLANISHEIRTPMNAILGLLSLTLDSELEHKQREQLEGARTAASSLLGMLTDILDLSKIEAGRFELISSVFDLRKMASSLQALFSAEAAAKGIAFRLAIGDDVPIWVEGDRDRLRQVLVNLLSNALKFTEKGGVRLSIRRQDGGTGWHRILFEVWDSGIGIGRDQRELIFEGFRQADGSITRRFGGFGLGLAISRKLVGLMNGVMDLESWEGQGSCFRVWVPFREASAPPEEPAERTDQPGEKLRVLVAEDNLLNQKVAQRLLEKRGHEVVLASTGLLALDAATRGAFDVVVMDLQMPEMDGIEATRRLRESSDEEERSVPVLGFTASALPEDREACMAVGMNGLVNKPVEPKLFIQEVERLGKQRQRDRKAANLPG